LYLLASAPFSSMVHLRRRKQRGAVYFL
jgi:hypothetical protein